MIMRTFAEALDFEGKRVYPVTTHAVGGLCGVPDSAGAADEWLRRVGLS